MFNLKTVPSLLQKPQKYTHKFLLSTFILGYLLYIPLALASLYYHFNHVWLLPFQLHSTFLDFMQRPDYVLWWLLKFLPIFLIFIKIDILKKILPFIIIIYLVMCYYLEYNIYGYSLFTSLGLMAFLPYLIQVQETDNN